MKDVFFIYFEFCSRLFSMYIFTFKIIFNCLKVNNLINYKSSISTFNSYTKKLNLRMFMITNEYNNLYKLI